MKTCTACARELAEEAFTFKSAARGTRHARCRECTRSMVRAHYVANKADYVARNRRLRADVKAMIADAKSVPCTDCGVSYPPFVMDMDHAPGSGKVFELATAARWGRSRPAVRAEIGKCEAVCANCHRIRTHNRRIAA